MKSNEMDFESPLELARNVTIPFYLLDCLKEAFTTCHVSKDIKDHGHGFLFP